MWLFRRFKKFIEISSLSQCLVKASRKFIFPDAFIQRRDKSQRFKIFPHQGVLLMTLSRRKKSIGKTLPNVFQTFFYLFWSGKTVISSSEHWLSNKINRKLCLTTNNKSIARRIERKNSNLFKATEKTKSRKIVEH